MRNRHCTTGHKCRVNDCPNEIGCFEVMCRPHWAKVPDAEADAVKAAYEFWAENPNDHSWKTVIEALAAAITAVNSFSFTVKIEMVN